MTISDEAWLAEARRRVASGKDWERPAEELERDAAELRATRPPVTEPACPYCDTHPPLEVFRRYEVVTGSPLLYCPACYGFWAAGDALARGVADAHDDHPALRAAEAPRRCRACNGHLKPDNVCAKCGRELPRLACPECGWMMDRHEQAGVTLDTCAACRGVWYDMGEIARVYQLPPLPQGLAASTVDEHAMDDAPPAWLLALDIVLSLVGAFIPMPFRIGRL